MYLEMGAPVFDASMVTFTADACAAETREMKSAASNTADAFNAEILIADCMMDSSLEEPGKKLCPVHRGTIAMSGRVDQIRP
jgi:hypothetical protein